MNIIFTDKYQLKGIIDEPKPASAFLPDWYKNITSYVTGKKEPPPTLEGTNSTIKKCVPVFDAITAGYIITLPCDVHVKTVDDKPFYTWSSFSAIEFHGVEQFTGHPKAMGDFDAPKFMTPWGIKTPKGWSVLIVQPMHRPSPFTILPGVVDTDTYTNNVNFPFVLNDIKFEGMIPAGTPIAQIIPIKRERWKMYLGGFEELEEQKQIVTKFQTVFFDRYKRFWWHKKEYK